MESDNIAESCWLGRSQEYTNKRFDTATHSSSQVREKFYPQIIYKMTFAWDGRKKYCRFVHINQKAISWCNKCEENILYQKIPLLKYYWFDFLPRNGSREHYFVSAAWVSQTEVSVVWMNRAQNLSVVTLCKSPMWYCQEVRNSLP